MNPFMKMRMANRAKGSMRAEGDVIWLYDVIASDDDEAEWWGGISPRQFIAALKATAGPVTLRINSPGGSVFGAQAMVAAMRAHSQPITAQIDSLAASAASVIACEAATLVMSPGAMLMIHKAWGMTVGNVDDHTATGELLQKIDGQIAETYARRGSANVDDFLALMAAETWFTVDEALAAGLCDAAIVENLQRPTSSDAAASWDLSGFQNAPAMIAPAASAQVPNDPAPDTSKDLAEMRVRSLAARLAATKF